jgi:hypothetical protein
MLAIEPDRGLERFGSPGFEADPGVTPAPGLGQEMHQHRLAHAVPAPFRGGAHRFQFAMIVRQMPQGADAGDGFPIHADQKVTSGWRSAVTGRAWTLSAGECRCMSARWYATRACTLLARQRVLDEAQRWMSCRPMPVLCP